MNCIRYERSLWRLCTEDHRRYWKLEPDERWWELFDAEYPEGEVLTMIPASGWRHVRDEDVPPQVALLLKLESAGEA